MEQALLNYLNTTQKLLLVHMRIFLCVSQSPVSQLSRLMIFRDFWKQCANVCLTKNWHNGGKARAVTLQQRGVFNKLPHCPVWCSGNNLHTHCASQVNPRLRTSFWGNLMWEKDWLHGKVEFLHRKFWVFLLFFVMQCSKRSVNSYIYKTWPSQAVCNQGRKTTRPALTATSTIEHDRANRYAAFSLRKNLRGGSFVRHNKLSLHCHTTVEEEG